MKPPSRNPALFEHHEAVRALDLSRLKGQDLINVALQRWVVLYDVPKYRRAVFGAYTKGNHAPLHRAVAEKGQELAYRAAAVIYEEYLALRPVIDRLAPGRIADIGCGYGFFDMFLAKDHDLKFVMIDIEHNDNIHFVHSDNPSAYNDLSLTGALMRDNGIAASKIKTVNPEKQRLSGFRGIDLAYSSFSCGFHFPTAVYEKFFDESVADNGAIIVDLEPKVADAEKATLGRFGPVETLWSSRHSERVLVQKR